MLIQNFKIPSSLQDNNFILSLYEQSLKRTLSEKQINALKGMLDIKIPLQEYKLQTAKVYNRHFYRFDYHGDLLEDTEKVYNLDINKIDTKIQNAVAAKYNSVSYINEYTFKYEKEIPSNVDNIRYFMDFYYADYVELLAKIERNKFRSTKTRNNAVILLNKMINGDVNQMENVPTYNYNHR